MNLIALYLVFLAILVGMEQPACAGVLLDLGGTYVGDTLSASTSSSSTKYLYNLGILFNINKDLWGGWSYLGVSHNESSSGTSTTYSSMDTGPTIKYQFGRGHVYSLSGTINLISRGTYTTSGASSEKWEGLSYLFSVGFMPEVKEGIHVGATLNYFMASYSKKTVNNTESSASNSKSWIFPALSLTTSW